jgi:hypothetical protein
VKASTTSNERTRLSVAFTAFSDGTKLPIFTIIPWKTAIAFDCPENVEVAYNTSSTFDSEMILSYLQRIVVPHMMRKNFEKMLLIFDEASCHLNPKVADFCKLHSIFIITVPGKMMNLLQPADVCWFASIKRAYREFWTNWYIYDPKTFTRNFNARSPGYVTCIQWLGQLWQDLEKDLIVRSFVLTGIKSHLFDSTTKQLAVNTSSLHSCLRAMLETVVTIQDQLSIEPDLDELDTFCNENDPGIFEPGKNFLDSYEEQNDVTGAMDLVEDDYDEWADLEDEQASITPPPGPAKTTERERSAQLQLQERTKATTSRNF